MADFKENLLALYTKAGVKGIPITFLMTDNQIVNEKFLVYINDLLSTGYIADLCTTEDKDTFCNSVRGEVKQAGMIDTPENCWDFFIDKASTVRCFCIVQLGPVQVCSQTEAALNFSYRNIETCGNLESSTQIEGHVLLKQTMYM